jgi:hypothetical protein
MLNKNRRFAEYLPDKNKKNPRTDFLKLVRGIRLGHIDIFYPLPNSVLFYSISAFLKRLVHVKYILYLISRS